jgi:hypothetical protein
VNSNSYRHRARSQKTSVVYYYVPLIMVRRLNLCGLVREGLKAGDCDYSLINKEDAPSLLYI